MRKVLIVILIIVVLAGIGLLVFSILMPKLSAENRQIDAWISANNLNSYGDEQNTVYSNGKPCETTAKCIDYIEKMHPDKPWEK